jgi:hypothetical protein
VTVHTFSKARPPREQHTEEADRDQLGREPRPDRGGYREQRERAQPDERRNHNAAPSPVIADQPGDSLAVFAESPVRCRQRRNVVYASRRIATAARVSVAQTDSNWFTNSPRQCQNSA